MAHATHVETLIFESTGAQNDSNKNKSSKLQCIFCPAIFSEINNGNESLLKHMLMEHKFVIADVNLIADIYKYCDYWRERFLNKSIGEFCSVIKTNSGENDLAASEFYYLLCDILPEDKSLREKLQSDRLKSVLDHQQKERDDKTFSKTCLFCKKHFLGNRMELFSHMNTDHAFNIGHPDNIVYGDEFLDLLDSKLKKLECLYCERTFKTWDTLKEHMRKKQHKRINPKNSEYDKFYLINYLELGKNWEAIQTDDDKIIDNELTEDWNDWQEEGLGAFCLFCKVASIDIEKLIEHMNIEHGFNLWDVKSKLNLNFYQQVKVVNYIRKQINLKRCIKCNEKLDSQSSLLNHMTENGHFSLGEKSEWDQPQYFFPTYENDTLLFMLEDATDDNAVTEGVAVIPEDISVHKQSVLLDEDLRKQLV